MHINDHNPLLPYVPTADRYERMKYRYCGKSGIQLPEISLGLWHNFGHNADFTLGRRILRRALTWGFATLIWPTTTVLPLDRQRKILDACSRRISFPTETNS